MRAIDLSTIFLKNPYRKQDRLVDDLKYLHKFYKDPKLSYVF